MDFTKIPEWFIEEYNSKFVEDKSHTKKEIEEDILLWAWVMLGIKIRIHQAWIIYSILHCKNKRILICLSRQLGKSIGLGIFAFWMSFYNRYPCTIEKNTPIYIMSRDDDVAKELLEKIRGLIKLGDIRVEELKNERNYFSQYYGKPNHQHQITWVHNRSFIKSVPPTDSAIGKSAAIFIIDEFAKLKVIAPYDDRRLYTEVVEPTTSETHGWIIGSSTPNGVGNKFYDLFDPDEKYEEHVFDRIWFDYTIFADEKSLDDINAKLEAGEVVSENELYKKTVMDKKKEAEQNGEIKLWQQEYGAKFTVTQQSFFDYVDIIKGINSKLSNEYNWNGTSCAGVDYGSDPSRTVVTMVAKTNKIILVNQIRFQAGFDLNNLMKDEFTENSLANLKKRYNIKQFVADDCAMGEVINKWMRSQGWDVRLYNFRSNQDIKKHGEITRNSAYYKFKIALRAGKIQYPDLKILIEEMKSVEEVQHDVNISIKSPRGSLCDTVDSFMMGCLPFLDGKGEVSCRISADAKSAPTQINPLQDKEWEDLVAKDTSSWLIKRIKEVNENGNRKG